MYCNLNGKGTVFSLVADGKYKIGTFFKCVLCYFSYFISFYVYSLQEEIY